MNKLSHCIASISLALLSFNALAVDLTAALPSRLADIKAGERQIELLGTPAILQQTAPDFKVADQAFKAVKLSDFKGKTVLLSVVPSLDTGVCSIQTKKFNQEVAALPADVVVMTISTDLPFAQKRFCVQEKVDKLLVLSDAVWGDFGSSYGLRIKDMGILSRAVLIIDASGKLVYQQLVPSLGQEPDYAAALAELKTISAKKS
jgi:thiol peroxidase